MAAAMIEELLADHERIRTYLDLFEEQAKRFAAGEDADISLLKRIAEFFAEFPDQRHHRLEDLIYDQLVRRGEELLSLREEHERVLAGVTLFRDAVGQILLDQELPREEFARTALNFIRAYRAHFEAEEKDVFPRAQSLTGDDWKEIARGVAAIDAEPIEPLRRARLNAAEEAIAAYLD